MHFAIRMVTITCDMQVTKLSILSREDFIMLTLCQCECVCAQALLKSFCCKKEMCLRMAGIEYEVKPALPMNAPKGKLPYIEDRDIILGDSDFLVLYLKEK